MSLIKQSDVKNHLSPRYRTKIHLREPVSLCDTASLSAAEPDTIQIDPLHFAADFVAEHSSPGTALAPGHPVTCLIDSQAPVASEIVQA